MADGWLIAVEGIDRSGKTTLVAALAAQLAARGWLVAMRTEPSRGPVGVLFRDLSADPQLPAMAAVLLSAADRHEQQPSLAADLAACDLVLSDRYFLSGLAYHSVDGIDPGFYRSLNEGIRRPDLYLYLQVAPALAAARGDPPHGRWEQPRFTAALPGAYRNAMRLLTEREAAQVAVVDAAQPPDKLVADALAALLPMLEGKTAA